MLKVRLHPLQRNLVRPLDRPFFTTCSCPQCGHGGRAGAARSITSTVPVLCLGESARTTYSRCACVNLPSCAISFTNSLCLISHLRLPALIRYSTSMRRSVAHRVSSSISIATTAKKNQRSSCLSLSGVPFHLSASARGSRRSAITGQAFANSAFSAINLR